MKKSETTTITTVIVCIDTTIKIVYIDTTIRSNEYKWLKSIIIESVKWINISEIIAMNTHEIRAN